MNKKFKILVVIFGILTIIVGLFLYFNKSKENKKDETDIQDTVDSNIKAEINNKLESLLIDRFCFIDSESEEKYEENCIFTKKETDLKNLSEAFRIYSIVLANLDNSTKIEIKEDEIIEADDPRIIGTEQLMATNYISKETIQKQYENLYGKTFNATEVNLIELLPLIHYNEVEEKFYISNIKSNIKIITKNLSYISDKDNLYVEVAAVFAIKTEKSYQLYSDLKFENATVNIEDNKILEYQIDTDNSDYTKYKFTFVKNSNNEYNFSKVEMLTK